MSVRYRTMQEYAATVIRERILSGELEAGSRIDQDALAVEFGMSRMPIREALRELAVTGLVTVVPHRHVVVSSLEPHEIEETYEMRSVLEGLACRLAVPNLLPSDLDRMADVLQAMRNSDDPGDWIRLNGEFHAIIEQACGRARVLELITQLRSQCEPYVRIYLNQLERHAQAHDEHEAVLRASRAGSEAEAERAMQAHLLTTGRNVASWVRSQKSGEYPLATTPDP
jgi:DNA-binding GntR family transcriptional regulator